VELSTWLVYLIVKLDDICMASLMIIVFSFVLLLFLFMNMEDDENYFHKRSSKILMGTLIVFTLLATFIPSTKQMITILILPKIVNNERIQSVAGNTLKSVDDLVKIANDYLKKKLKDE
jgi:predicted CDP-diglyceride synthetase/phosphatidate cytidylyltransferase